MESISQVPVLLSVRSKWFIRLCWHYWSYYCIYQEVRHSRPAGRSVIYVGCVYILMYACFPLLLVNPLSSDERGVLLLPGSCFTDNLLIALSTSFCPLAKSCNALNRLRNSILTSSSPVPFPLSECIPWYLLVGYPQSPLCTYYSFSYRLQKCHLLYSSTSHVQAHSWQRTCFNTTVISQLIFLVLIIYCSLCVSGVFEI